MRQLACVLMMLCASCAVDSLAFVTPDQALTKFSDSTLAAPLYTFKDWQAVEETTLREALAETGRIVRSADFQNHLGAVRNLHESRSGSAIGGDLLLELYLSGRVPVTYVKAAKSCETADTDTKRERTDGPLHAVTNLGPQNLQRWAGEEDPNEVFKRGCLINTLAHEWTHAIPDDEGHPRFQDGWHTCSSVPLVSYTVGSVAQCAYLKDKKKLSPEKFWACVKHVGTRVFNDVCSNGAWLDKL